MTAVRGQTFEVIGYRELMRTIALADRATKRSMRNVIRQAGVEVQRDSAGHVLDLKGEKEGGRTAAGYKVYVRQRGVSVEQSLRKTTGLHPEFGGWQMRHALLPSLAESAPKTDERMRRALEIVARRFNEEGVSI